MNEQPLNRDQLPGADLNAARRASLTAVTAVS